MPGIAERVARLRSLGRRIDVSRAANPADPIFVELVGGLGNQLFGFAAGLRQAERLGVPLALHHSCAATDTPRSFDLSWLLEDGVIVAAEAAHGPEYRETSFRFDPAIEAIGPGTILRGYFQALGYLPRSGLRERMRTRLAAVNAGASTVPTEPFIAVHIRGGDYRSEQGQAFHGLCDDAYFSAGLAATRATMGDLPVRVFSDDADGLEQGLRLFPGAHGEVGPHTTALMDLEAMSHASALVISNSTFGWWGAWLADAPLVICPAPWFAYERLDTSDLIPRTWRTLPARVSGP